MKSATLIACLMGAVAPVAAQTQGGPEAQIPPTEFRVILQCGAEGPAAPASCALACSSSAGDDVTFEHVHRAAIGRIIESNAADAVLVVALRLNYPDGQSRSALWIGQGATSCHTVVPDEEDERMLEPADSASQQP